MVRACFAVHSWLLAATALAVNVDGQSVSPMLRGTGALLREEKDSCIELFQPLLGEHRFFHSLDGEEGCCLLSKAAEGLQVLRDVVSCGAFTPQGDASAVTVGRGGDTQGGLDATAMRNCAADSVSTLIQNFHSCCESWNPGQVGGDASRYSDCMRRTASATIRCCYRRSARTERASTTT